MPQVLRHAYLKEGKPWPPEILHKDHIILVAAREDEIAIDIYYWSYEDDDADG